MKNVNFKKLLSLIVAVMMTLTIVMPLNNIIAKAATVKTIHLVEVTDFHGSLLDSSLNKVGAVLANRIKAIKEANPNDTLIIGGGDLYQGSAISNINQGVPVQKFFTDMGMQVTALGNHEFDWTLDTINNVTMKDAGYSIVCSNVYDKTTGKRVYDPYKVITVDGVRIALVGGITNDTPNIVMPANIANYEFRDLATEVNSVVKDIRDNNKADVVIAVLHEGGDALNAVVNKLQGVDAVLGGHSHTVYDDVVNGIPVVNANSAGKGYVDLQLMVGSDGKYSFSAKGTNYHALDNADGYKTANPVVDPAADKIITDAYSSIAPTVNEVIGKNTNSENLLTSKQVTYGTGSGTYGESYLGDWMADAVRSTVKADIGMVNNGGIRISPIPNGDVTVNTMWQIMPFDNIIYKVKVNKAQLKAILEDAVKDGGKGIQVSGIQFSYDSDMPTGNRVYKITREDGTPISDTEQLVIAAPDFIATGGDGFASFVAADGKNADNNTGILVRDALINYVKASKDQDPSVVTTMDHRLVNSPNPDIKKISIVGTSDIHGAVYPMDYNTQLPSNVGLARVSTYVNNLRAANPNVMLIDNGDTIQGTPLVYYYNMIDKTAEYPMMKVMGAMKYDTWTLGNHEFNYGLDTLNRVIADAEKEGITVLSANTYKTNSNTNFVKPYYVKTFHVNGKDIKVGILGLTTKTIPSWEDPAHYAGLKFNDLVTEAQKWVPIMKNEEKCDVVIVSAHSGVSSPSDTIPENEIDGIAKNVSGIDAILAGHTHSGKTYSFTNPDGKTVPVVEPKNGDGIFSQIDINVDTDGNIVNVSGKDIDTSKDNTLVADPNILAVAQPYQDKTLEYTNTVIGKSTEEFTGAGQTAGPTAIMELINKVQMSAAKSQLSIAAPLSASARIPQGEIKRQDIMGVYVYENFLFGVNMTGKQLKNWLEWSVRYYKQTTNANDPIVKDPVLNVPDYNLDQLYGATYDIDLSQPACTTDANGLVTSGNRIKNLMVNGVPVKDTDVFKVAINNYRYNGGGGFMAAAGLTPGSAATIAATYYDSAKALGDDGQVRNMMFKYVQDNGTISPTNSNNWKIYTTSAAVPTSTATTPTTPSTGKALKTMTVTAKAPLNVRAAASLKGARVGALRFGAKVNVFELVNGFYRIVYKGKVAYISASYVK